VISGTSSFHSVIVFSCIFTAFTPPPNTFIFCFSAEKVVPEREKTRINAIMTGTILFTEITSFKNSCSCVFSTLSKKEKNIQPRLPLFCSGEEARSINSCARFFERERIFSHREYVIIFRLFTHKKCSIDEDEQENIHGQ